MAAKPVYRPTTRDGVKGHIIKVEEHDKFVPNKYPAAHRGKRR